MVLWNLFPSYNFNTLRLEEAERCICACACIWLSLWNEPEYEDSSTTHL